MEVKWTLPKTASKEDHIICKMENAGFMRLEKADMILIFILFFVSILVRTLFPRHPNCVVFDESYFGNFTNFYIRREYFVDIHPPLGKIILLGISRIAGYDGSLEFGLPSSNNPYKNGMYIRIRALLSFLSSFDSTLVYLTLLALGNSRISSFSSSMMICFDNCLIIEGRFILTDGILHFFTLFSIFSAALLQSLIRSDKFNICFLVSSILTGVIISIKHTAGGAAVVSLIMIFISLYSRTNSITTALMRVSGSLFIVASIYIASYIVHILILTHPGPESYHVCPNMAGHFYNSSLARKEWELCKKQPLHTQIRTLMKYMRETNAKSIDSNQLSSAFWQWPLGFRLTIPYYFDQGKRINLHYNVANNIIGVISISLYLLYYSFTGLNEVCLTVNKQFFGFLFAIGYLISYLPFVLVTRSTYLYHYLIPHIFGLMTFGFLADALKPHIKRVLCTLLVLSSLSSYLLKFHSIYGDL